MTYQSLRIGSPKRAVIERLGRGKNSVFVESRSPNMVSTKKPPQAQPPSREMTFPEEIGTHPDTNENENLVYEVVRYEPKSFRQRHHKDGGLS